MLPLFSRINSRLPSINHSLISPLHRVLWVALLPLIPWTQHSHHPSPLRSFTPVFETFLFCQFFQPQCGDAFPIERVLVATYLLSVEALPHCRWGVANKSWMVWRWLVLIGWGDCFDVSSRVAIRLAAVRVLHLVMRRWWKQRRVSEPGTALARGWTALCSIVWYDVFDCIVVV